MKKDQYFELGFTPEDEARMLQLLPPEYAALRFRYPNSICNAIDFWDDAPLPVNYKPKYIEIYYADKADSPHIYFENDFVKYINLPADVGQSQVIQVWIDGECSYVEVEKQIILNKLGNVQLPLPQVTATTIANSLHLLRN
ncbi:hypothetical protein [Brasilonema sp. UFV-L1]|uniref:hypothetical protein n=1 Tax=Brasilonema sp. UFV-L1 TaxID=2234130 RepID=UPI00145DAFD6|nr:hypothetical protein [Brasilonema sp. UFV-L1]NMG09754.1 hypothetical protein [Brasilonema sp. UFV-L1]